MSSTLFELQEDFLCLYEMGEDEEAFKDSLESLEFDLENKAEGYVNLMKQLEMEADKADEVAKQFSAKATARRNNIKALKNRLKSFMDATDKKKIPAGDFTIVYKKNGGLRPLYYDESKVPQDFIENKPEINKKKIRDYLKEHDVPWARLEDAGYHIEVK